MIPLIGPIFALVDCLLTVVFFEALYKALKTDPVVTISKFTACIGWWIVIMIVSAIILILKWGCLVLLLNLPFLVAGAVSHCQLARTQDSVISIKDVATNIPCAARTCIDWLRAIAHK